MTGIYKHVKLLEINLSLSLSLSLCLLCRDHFQTLQKNPAIPLPFANIRRHKDSPPVSSLNLWSHQTSMQDRFYGIRGGFHYSASSSLLPSLLGFLNKIWRATLQTGFCSDSLSFQRFLLRSLKHSYQPFRH